MIALYFWRITCDNTFFIPTSLKIYILMVNAAEFSCQICRNVMNLPLTTPCAHNFCKACLEGAFAGQSFMRQRTCEGRRTLRAQKNIMKCPSCSIDISDFLQNPQVRHNYILRYSLSYLRWGTSMLSFGIFTLELVYYDGFKILKALECASESMMILTNRFKSQLMTKWMGMVEAFICYHNPVNLFCCIGRLMRL